VFSVGGDFPSGSSCNVLIGLSLLGDSRWLLRRDQSIMMLLAPTPKTTNVVLGFARLSSATNHRQFHDSS
jgi:hypothetical protein